MSTTSVPVNEDGSGEDRGPDAARISARILDVVLSEVLAYARTLFGVPLLLCAMAVIAFAVVILQDVYPHVAGVTVLPLLGWLPRHFELDTRGFLELYGALSVGWYLIGLVIRLIRGDRPALRYRTRLVAGVGLSTFCWGIVIAHVPNLQVAAGSTHRALAWVFFGFYLLSIGAFVGTIAISAVGDRLLAVVATMAKARRTTA